MTIITHRIQEHSNYSSFSESRDPPWKVSRVSKLVLGILVISACITSTFASALSDATTLKCPTVPGRYDLSSPVIGFRKSEIHKIYSSVFTPVLRHFADVLYHSNSYRSLIPENEINQYNENTKEILNQYISKYAQYGCTIDNMIHIDLDDASNVQWNPDEITLISAENRGKDVCSYENLPESCKCSALVRVPSEHVCLDGDCIPQPLVVLHEIMHLEECMGRSDHNLSELLTTLRGHIFTDLAYKPKNGS